MKLSGIFSPYSKFYQKMYQFADLALVNIIFLASCLPIITIGPAFVGLFHLKKMQVLKKDIPVIRTYVSFFKKTFIPATLVFLLFVMFMMFMVVNLRIILMMGGIIKVLLVSMNITLMVIGSFFFIGSLLTLSDKKTSLFQAIRQGGLILLANPVKSIGMLGWGLAVILVPFLVWDMLGLGSFAIFVFFVCLPAFFLNKVATIYYCKMKKIAPDSLSPER